VDHFVNQRLRHLLVGLIDEPVGIERELVLAPFADAAGEAIG
jgi:hypothetical protein